MTGQRAVSAPGGVGRRRHTPRVRRGRQAPPRPWAAGGWIGAAVVAAVVGCAPADMPPTPRERQPVQVMPTVSEDVREQLLDGAVAVLDRLDEYEESSAFAQVFDRLSQWSHAAVIAGVPLADGWRVDPLFETLPGRLRAGATPESLGGATFDAAADVVWLRDQRWLADIAGAARGDAVEDLDIAVNLFQWTVRSLAIVSDPPMSATEAVPGTRWFLPGEILLSGRASPAQRAWIFLQLLRHVGIDGVMLATGDPQRGGLRAWIPAVIADGEAWLFEPTYGMPIAGPDGTGVATARQAAADPAVLRRLSFADRAYPLQAADMTGLSVLVAADPWSMSRRMRAVDGQLVGARAMKVAIDATGVATRALECLPPAEPAPAAGGRTALWEFPWEAVTQRGVAGPAVRAALARELSVMSVELRQSAAGDGVEGRRTTRIVRPLYAARLREFRGDLDGPDGAKVSYLAARPSRQVVAEAVKGVPPEQADALRRLFEQMKEDATYWLGILTLNEGENATAVDYLQRMTLQAAPDSRWTDAARVNLAAAMTALGRVDEAVALLRDDASPQRFGSRLRAEQLGGRREAARPRQAGENAAEP